MCNVEKQKILAAMLRGNDAMKTIISQKAKRIALISIAVSVLMVCSPLTVFAANAPDTRTKVVYTGDGTTKSVQVLNAENLDTFQNLMPGGSTKAQEIIIQNKAKQKMKVYFYAEPAVNGADAAQSKKLLDTLKLQITFKMDDSSAVKTLYEGPASGKNGAAASSMASDVTANPILLGYVYGNSESGVISAKLTAPETVDNELQGASAKIKWVMQFELLDPVVISDNSVPLTPPASNVPENPTPLSPPATGDTRTSSYVWISAAVIVLASSVVLVMRLQNKKNQNSQK